MYMILNNILMVKSSCEIIFFRLEPKKGFKNIEGPAHVELEWVKYHDIDIVGFIYYRQGDTKFQLITDKLIYIFKFENDKGDFTEVPILQSVMVNFMACTSLMLDNDSKFCVAYKSG